MVSVVDPTAADIPSIDLPGDPGEGSSRSTGRGVTPLVAPIPFHNSQIGWGLLLMGGAIHRFDPDTTLKPSTGVAAGMVSDNGSWGVLAIEIARFSGDAWRVRAMAGHMDVRYDFYGVGIDAGQSGRSLAIEQQIDVAAASVLRRVTGPLYIGASTVWMGTTATPRDTTGVVLPPGTSDFSKTQLFAPGALAERDTRDDDYWPGRGSSVQLKGVFFTKALGGSRVFQRYVAAWSWYVPLSGPRLVLATNANACGAPGDTPFYGLCSLGAGRFALRGYTQGRYRDRYMTTVQAELRGHTSGRFGATIFGGFGQVAPSTSDILNAQMLLAGGFGLRYKLTKQYPMHMRLDLAWGRDEGVLYFAVSEAF